MTIVGIDSGTANGADAQAWAILGIAPTHDATAIRRSYAAALKRNGQEDDADGVVQLRAAYERAMQLAAGGNRPAPTASAPIPAAPPVPATEQVLLDMQALDLAVSAAEEPAAVRARFAACLRSGALENVGFASSFESIVARWLLARHPACDDLIAQAAERFGWRRRESSLEIDPAVPVLMGRLRDLTFWERLQAATGSRARARAALMAPPIAWRLRGLMLVTDLEAAARALLEELFRLHPAISPRFDSGALAWWRRYFSKPRLSMEWLRLLSATVPIVLLYVFVPRIFRDGHGTPALATAFWWLAASASVIGLLLSLKLFVIDRLRLWLLNRYREELPIWVRIGWFPAAAANLLLTAVLAGLPTAAGGVAASGALWLLWAALIEHRNLRPHLVLWRRIASSIAFGLPLVVGWFVFAGALDARRLAVLGASFLVLVAVERIGFATLVDDYAAALTGRRRTLVCWMLLGGACTVSLGNWLFIAHPSWVTLAAAVIAVLSLTVQPLDIFLSPEIQNMRTRILWASGFILLQFRPPQPAPLFSQAIALWLLAAPLTTVLTLLLRRESADGADR